ncbi:MAG: tetratricopeptide repeat protein [Thermomicrobiales bacterium]
MSGWIERLAGKGKRGGSGVLVQIAREVVGRRRSLQGAISEVRHPAVLDALSDDDFRELDELIAERLDSDREFAQVLARLTHAAAHAKGFDRQTVDAALRLDTMLPSDDPAREREKLLGDAYRAAQRTGYVQGGRRSLARLGQRAASSGDPERARVLLQQQIDLGPESADGEDEVDSAILLGDLLRRDGDAARSIELFDRAGTSAARIGYVSGLAPALLRQIDMKRATLRPEDLILLQQDALDAVAVTGDDAVQGALILDVARGFIHLGRNEEALAHLESGLAFARDIGDLQLENHCLEMLSSVERDLGRVNTAIERDHDKIAVEQRLGDHPRAAGDALSHAKTLLSMGRLDPARDSFQQAVDLATQIGDQLLEQRAAGGLGVTYSQMNRPVEALNHLMHALEIARAQGDDLHEAQWLGSIGEALWKFDQPDDAVQAIHQALTAAHRAGDQDLEAGMVSLLGKIHLSQRQPGKARDCYAHALSLYQTLGDTQEEISMLSALGAIAMDANQPQQAMTLYGDALELAAQAGERSSAVRLYGRLARLAQRQGDQDAALEALTQAVELAETVDQPALLSQALQHLAVAQDEMGMGSALDTYERALGLSRELGDDYAEAMLLVNVGARLLADGARRDASQILQHALSLIPGLGVSGERLQERAERLLAMAVPPPSSAAARTTPSRRPAGSSDRARLDQRDLVRRPVRQDPRQAAPDMRGGVIPQQFSSEPRAESQVQPR